MLGGAYVLCGDLESARSVVNKAFEMSTELQFVLGVGWAKQVLGRIERAENHMAEAMRNFTEAVASLRAIGARFELARTHLDLATLAREQGDAEFVQSQLLQANQLLLELQVPKYIERARWLGEQGALSLPH